MHEPQRPLRELLPHTTDEATVQRMWRGIRRRRAVREVPTVRRGPLLALSVAATAAAIVGFALWLTPSQVEPGAILRIDGASLDVIRHASGATDPMAVDLSDGSRVVLEPGARTEVLVNDGREVVTRVERGAARFDVRPGGPRRWRVQCDGVEVRVVGTSFTVRRLDEGVAVEVHHGTVSVRGGGLPGDGRRLVAGERLEVASDAVAEDSARSARDEPSRVSGEAPPPEPEMAPEQRPASKHRVREPAAVSRVDAHARADDAVPTAPSAAALMGQADLARAEGRAADAAHLLERVIAEHTGDAKASLAAFTLGRLELERERPADAARAFERALSLGLPETLREDALARAVEAWARAGQTERAASAAARYRLLYPDGHHPIDRWAAPR